MEAVRLQWTENLGRTIKGQTAAALTHRWSLSKGLRAAIWAITFLGLAGALLVCATHPRSYMEHGPLENFQAIMLVIGVLAFATHAVKAQRPHSIVGAGLALLCFIFLLLEFDTRAFDHPVLRKWTNGAIRNAWLGVLAGCYGVAVARSFSKTWHASLQWLATTPGLLMIISGGFWIAGAIFEAASGKINPIGSLMLEETMEVNAALFMALSGLWTAGARRAPQTL